MFGRINGHDNRSPHQAGRSTLQMAMESSTYVKSVVKGRSDLSTSEQRLHQKGPHAMVMAIVTEMPSRHSSAWVFLITSGSRAAFALSRQDVFLSTLTMKPGRRSHEQLEGW